jgi:VWFA-related protein
MKPALLFFFLIVLELTQPGRAQDAPPLFTTSTNSVLVDLAVTNDQRLVAGLEREDFVLLDDGQPRTITGFAHDELPLDIVLVCRSVLVGPAAPPSPNGDGVPGHHIGFQGSSVSQRLMSAAANAVLGSRPGDRVAVVTYGRDPHIELRFTADRKAIANAIRRAGGADDADENLVLTSEALAIEYAVRMIADVEREDLNARTNRRRLIIMISNVDGVGARYADEPIIRRLWEQNIVFSVIEDLPPTKSTTSVQRSGGGESQTVLFRRYNPIHIAQATGGDRIVAMDPQHPGDLLTATRQRYTVWFNQPSDAAPGEVRTIRIDLSESARRRFPDAIVTAREGYVTR